MTLAPAFGSSLCFEKPALRFCSQIYAQAALCWKVAPLCRQLNFHAPKWPELVRGDSVRCFSISSWSFFAFSDEARVKNWSWCCLKSCYCSWNYSSFSCAVFSFFPSSSCVHGMIDHQRCCCHLSYCCLHFFFDGVFSSSFFCACSPFFSSFSCCFLRHQKSLYPY